MTWDDFSPFVSAQSPFKQDTSGNKFLARYARSMCCLKIAKCSAFWRFNMLND
jgi:hypothetical protein